jgi:tetratricopeptide (TPR) repeat protein
MAILFLFSLLWLKSEGQQDTLPIDEWISKLSAKKDFRFEKFASVNQQIAKLDSTNRCWVITAMESHGPKLNKRFLLKLDLIKANLSVEANLCSANISAESLEKEGLQKAYEVEDEYLIAVMHQALMGEYTRQGKYGMSVMHGLLAMEVMKTLGEQNFGGLAYGRYTLGYSLYHSREYDQAIPVFRQAIKGFFYPGVGSVDTMSPYYKMFSWNTIGLCYQRLEKYDSASIAFHEALRIAEHDKELFWTGLIKGNLGDVFFSLGQYDSAQFLLKKDIEQSISSNQFDNAANSMQLVAQIDAFHGQTELGLQKLREASRLLQKMPNEHVLMNLYKAYTVVFQKLGEADSLYFYVQKYLVLHDAAERTASNDRAEIVKMRLDNVESANKIFSLNKEKRKITLIRNFSFSLILLATLVGFLYFNKERLKMKLQQQKALEEKRIAQSDADAARDQLQIFTQNIMEKTNLVEKLQEQLMQRDLNEMQIEHITSLSQHTILTDADWDHFKGLFEKVYPGFFIHLKDTTPDITVAEQRIAALSKLRIPAKEAAALLGISPNSVHKTRQRLRSRLGLDPDADLEIYFSKAEELPPLKGGIDF